MLRYQIFYHTNDNWRRSSLRKLRLCQRSKAVPSVKVETGEKCHEAGSLLDKNGLRRYCCVMWRTKTLSLFVCISVFFDRSCSGQKTLWSSKWRQGHSCLNANGLKQEKKNQGNLNKVPLKFHINHPMLPWCRKFHRYSSRSTQELRCKWIHSMRLQTQAGRGAHLKKSTKNTHNNMQVLTHKSWLSFPHYSIFASPTHALPLLFSFLFPILLAAGI